MGYCEAPDEFIFSPRRTTAPPAQRTPSPKTTPAFWPEPKSVVPWKKSAELSGMPEACSTRSSEETLGRPVHVSRAPSEFTELPQPWPPAPSLPHGQSVSLPSPEQIETIGCAGCSTRTKPACGALGWPTAL